MTQLRGFIWTITLLLLPWSVFAAEVPSSPGSLDWEGTSMSTDRLTTLLIALILAVLLVFLVKPFVGTPLVSAGSSTPSDQLVALGGISPGVTAAALLNPRTSDAWLVSIHPAILKPILEWRGRIEELSACAR